MIIHHAKLQEMEDESEAVYRATIGHDPDTEDPSQEGVVRYMYDNDRNFDRDVMVCHKCGEDSDFPLHDPNSKHRAMMSIHKFEWHPRVVEFLRVGMRISREEVPDWAFYDDFSRDTNLNNTAIVVTSDYSDDLAYWNNLDDEQKEEILKSLHDVWETWAEGYTYWVSIEKINRHNCGECNRKLDDEPIDSCGGFIGDVAAWDFIYEVVGEEPVYVKESYD